jgi:ankyrin repeat protein
MVQRQLESKQRKKVNRYFWDAAETGNTRCVEDILNTKKYGDSTADVNSRGQDNWSTLHLAANEGY